MTGATIGTMMRDEGFDFKRMPGATLTGISSGIIAARTGSVMRTAMVIGAGIATAIITVTR